MKVKQEESVMWLFLKIKPSTTISMKRSRRELSIDMVIHRGIFKNNQITLSRFTFIPKTGVSFHCALRKNVTVSVKLSVICQRVSPRLSASTDKFKSVFHPPIKKETELFKDSPIFERF